MKTVFLITLLISTNVNPLFFSTPTFSTTTKTGLAVFSGVCTGGAAALLLPVTDHYPSLKEKRWVIYPLLSATLLASNYLMNKHFIGKGFDSLSSWISTGTFSIVSFLMMLRDH